MASTTAMMARAVVVAVLLMQCCSVILAARPLLHAAAGDNGRGWQLGQGGEALIMQALDGGPGEGNCHDWKDPSHPNCPPPAAVAVMP